MSKTNKNKKTPFANHLQELRIRIQWYIFSLLVGSLVGYYIHERVLNILIRPLNQPVFYVSPAGGLDFVVKLSFFSGFILSLPVFVYHLIRFIEPAFDSRKPLLMAIVLITSSILLCSGLAFAYFVSLPATLHFLSQFVNEDIKPIISTHEYFSFVTVYLLGFGLAFQMPLVVLAVNAIQKIPVKKLISFERWLIALSFIFAGIITPTPDIFNQFIMAMVLITLYQITIFAVWLMNKRKLDLGTDSV